MAKLLLKAWFSDTEATPVYNYQCYTQVGRFFFSVFQNNFPVRSDHFSFLPKPEPCGASRTYSPPWVRWKELISGLQLLLDIVLSPRESFYICFKAWTVSPKLAGRLTECLPNLPGVSLILVFLLSFHLAICKFYWFPWLLYQGKQALYSGCWTQITKASNGRKCSSKYI